MIPVVLVTGFLGSGKTTFLRRIIATHRDRRLAYLVNEFAPVDVDGRLLAAEGVRVVSLPGGSIFCQCLVGSFIEQLRGIVERFHRPSEPLEGLVVEASGIADPGVAGRMLRETRLDQVYRLSRVISVVDPGSFSKLLHTLPNITAQIEASDLAIINKADLFGEADLGEVERQLAAIKPGLSVVRASYCRVDVDLLGFQHVAGPSGDYASRADPLFAVMCLTMDGPVNIDALVEAIRSAGESVYRAKGRVPTDEGMMCLDCSASGIATGPASDSGSTGQLVLVCNPAAQAEVGGVLARWGSVRTMTRSAPPSVVQLGLPKTPS